jgi:hypothetical protein
MLFAGYLEKLRLETEQNIEITSHIDFLFGIIVA